MREEFRNEMRVLEETLTLMARSASKAMDQAAQSLRDANLGLAESVIDADSHIDHLERQIEEMAISLLARQAPVASDLRTVVTALRIATILERMGDLARHVAYIARGRFPQTAVDGDAYDLIVKMGEAAAKQGQRVAKMIETQDIELAKQLEADDDKLDELHRQTFDLVLDESNDLSRQTVVDVILLGRFLERYGDQGVNAARNMRFLITGLHVDVEPRPSTEEEMLG
ncbi:phosphate transport system protein [Actinobaculum suis]|uniref:Phosphate-specific transport system accessory protein PhoU n=1 Tax=Actinobaculum suis TaxID=1657 RepID=A0A0K9ETS6_9ACTO|nr:phosphate signaling complex protein PhoU [Actinobaculum suis]KMY23272.1 PhoU family transcriptional regulator [Actinobaculum suis]MDY5153707.1 phosphate signaling complex protein PhoU [Actinobaculum suis]OCA95349.1 phosphate transport system regulatory protein PhoU [Actinobaculum suis]OCA95934.1 phosphate transport system regulatory protein PhoU [Actinobaculum suis]SDE62127.1 phosphate transport system protein [Actinobaculum suis]